MGLIELNDLFDEVSVRGEFILVLSLYPLLVDLDQVDL